MSGWDYVWITLGAIVLVIAIHDLTQRKYPVLRIFPVMGHLRYFLMEIGPELRQYIVAQNREELPFNRSEREWIYRSANGENNYFGFGTDDQVYGIGYPVIKHAVFSSSDKPYTGGHHEKCAPIPCAKVIGKRHNRRMPYQPPSIINISAMSFGSLGRNAVSALNTGAKLAGAYHNTGEGGCSRFHRLGADVCWQIGTGYFGARDGEGRFSMSAFLDTVASAPVRAVEIKLSQGAKPGLGGLLPGAKVTQDIAAIRGIPIGRDCVSPAAHSAFHDVDSMLDFIELLADRTGLPVGIKSAVGEMSFWRTLARRIHETGRAPDFITIDGGEGGTGAAPLTFSDHVAMPFKLGFSAVYRELARQGVNEHVVMIGSGKLGFPETGLLALALGCDMINVAREAMLAIGCIQAQRCHTGHCPTGVATQDKWLMAGLDPTFKSARLANYITSLRMELLHLAHACGEVHPALVALERFEILDDTFGSRPAREVFQYDDSWGLPRPDERAAIAALMRRDAVAMA